VTAEMVKARGSLQSLEGLVQQQNECQKNALSEAKRVNEEYTQGLAVINRAVASTRSAIGCQSSAILDMQTQLQR
jgi:hypothetical protein